MTEQTKTEPRILTVPITVEVTVTLERVAYRHIDDEDYYVHVGETYAGMVSETRIGGERSWFLVVDGQTLPGQHESLTDAVSALPLLSWYVKRNGLTS